MVPRRRRSIRPSTSCIGSCALSRAPFDPQPRADARRYRCPASEDRRPLVRDHVSALPAHPREDLGSALAAQAEKLCAKWKGAAGQLSFEEMLADICQFMALFSPEDAMAYFTFWAHFLGMRQAPAA